MVRSKFRGMRLRIPIQDGWVKRFDSKTVYIRADEDMEQVLIRRAVSNPKPMYYSEQFLRDQLAVFLKENKLNDVDDMDPEVFARWIFPELVKHRRPLYQDLADKYGYTISAGEAEQVNSEEDLLNLVELAIERAGS